MRLLRAFALLISGLFLLSVLAGGGVVYVLWRYGRDLPDYHQLANYEPPVMTRIHAGDGTLIAEYAHERRLFVPIEAIPRPVIRAFLAAEDKTFYSHPGVDVMGILAAVVHNLRNMGTSRRPVGASTITQQVAKNFLLSNEVSLTRKIKEAILAFRIEHAFSKDRILELYLNEIYLGFGSYGVAAAALNYFNKSLDELTLDQVAFLAALPKAPNNYHPIRHHDAALARRNWVLERLADDGAITRAQAKVAQQRPLLVHSPEPTRTARAAYFAEEVRRELVDHYGEQQLYEGGLSVRTTLEPAYQKLARKALQDGLEAYDRRHGWRGPIDHLEGAALADWPAALDRARAPELPEDWQLAVVLSTSDEAAEIGLTSGRKGRIPLAGLKWARPELKEGYVGPSVKRPSDVVKPGDVVAVSAAMDDDGKPTGTFELQQIPEINGAVVAMDPHTGRVLAMVGGFDFDESQFNRATQAMRQPGSAFKPIVYAAALEHGFNPSSMILDAPFVIDLGEQGQWKPANYSQKYYGPSTLRTGLEHSRNLMTVRLANYIGMDVVSDYAKRFGVIDDLPPYLPMALGAGETTLLKMVTAYSMFVNGGKQIEATLIDRIQDRRGKTIFKHDHRPCPNCLSGSWHDQPVPEIPDNRKQVVEPTTAYQVVSLMEGVVQRGTGWRLKDLDRPLAGKTGTTNDSRDAWFIGFSPDLAIGVYTGFDQPHTLGKHETGSSVAAPIFKEFVRGALKGTQPIPFRVPPGIQLVRVSADTGLPAGPGARDVILEAFKPGQVPEVSGPVLDGSLSASGEGGAARGGTGGLY